MTTAYLDCYNGISGDMTLGALVDLGVPVDELRTALETLPVRKWSISATRVKRCGIGATRVLVETTEDHHHRGFGKIRDHINNSPLPETVKSNAIEAFRRLAEAEAQVHETTLEEVHFHEVGAVDAIIDIVGSMWGFHYLGITSVAASAVAVGSGTVTAAHGVMPVPAPATALLLRDVPTYTGPIEKEQTTPTGAAILTALASSYGAQPVMRIARIGYGAGGREIPKHTNYLRIMLGETTAAPVEIDEVVMLEAEIDDAPAELLGGAMELLMQSGALDVHLVPVQMKKNRPGTGLRVLARRGDEEQLAATILRNTTTLGVRLLPTTRRILHRRMDKVATPFGEIRIKIALWDGEVLRAMPEFDDCRDAAASHGVPVGTVYGAALAEGQKLIGAKDRP